MAATTKTKATRKNGDWVRFPNGSKIKDVPLPPDERFVYDEISKTMSHLRDDSGQDGCQTGRAFTDAETKRNIFTKSIHEIGAVVDRLCDAGLDDKVELVLSLARSLR